MDFDLSAVPDQPAPRRPVAYPWGKQWFTTFSAVFVAVLAVQVLNLIIGYALFNRAVAKFGEGLNRPPAVDVKK